MISSYDQCSLGSAGDAQPLAAGARPRRDEGYYRYTSITPTLPRKPLTRLQRLKITPPCQRSPTGALTQSPPATNTAVTSANPLAAGSTWIVQEIARHGREADRQRSLYSSRQGHRELATGNGISPDFTANSFVLNNCPAARCARSDKW